METKGKRSLSAIAALVLAVLVGLGALGQDLGTPANPVQFLVPAWPSADLTARLAIAEDITGRLIRATGLHIEMVPAESVAIADRLGDSDGDAFGLVVSALDYVSQEGLTPRLCAVRYGTAHYYAAVYARRDSGIWTVGDLDGRDWCYPYPDSLSGLLLPWRFFATQGISPDGFVEAGSHTNALHALMNGDADFATSYYSPPSPSATCPGAVWTWGDDPEQWLWDRELGAIYPEEGRGTCHDARRPLLDYYGTEAVLSQIGVVAVLGPIPNDCLAFAPGFPQSLADLLVDAISADIQTEEGQYLWGDPNFLGWDSIAEVGDQFFDCLRRLAGIPIPNGRATGTCNYVANAGLPGVPALDTPQILTCICSGLGQAVRMFLEVMPNTARIVGGHIGRFCFNIDVKNETGIEADNLEVVIQGVLAPADVTWWFDGYARGPRFRNHGVFPNCARNETVLRWWNGTVPPGAVVHVGACVRNVARLVIKRIEWTRGAAVVGRLPACSFVLTDQQGDEQFAWQISNASEDPVTVSDVAFAMVGAEVPLEALNADELDEALRERGVQLEPCEDCGGTLGAGETGVMPVRALGHRFSLLEHDLLLLITVSPADPDEGESYTLSVTTIPAREGLEVELHVSGSDEWECSTAATTDSLGIARFPTEGDLCDDDVVDGRIPGAEAGTVETIRIVLPALNWSGEVTFIF